MPSINSDIRVPARANRSLFVLVGVAAIAFSIAFAASLVPSSASAAVGDALYIQCHNHQNDNGNPLIDLKDPACNDATNSAPVATDQSLTTPFQIALGVTLTATDADADLLYFATTTNPAHGTLSMLVANDTTATLTYTPAVGFSGSDTFNFRVHDGRLADTDSGTITITVGAAAAACSGAVPAELLVDTTQAVSNNPDSGFHGDWALDAFSKHMRVWAEGEHYCGQTDDVGTFVTTGPNSPGIPGETVLPLAAGINGTFSGGARYVIHGSFAPVWPTSGTVPPKNDGIGGGYSSWVAQYFPGETHEFYYWHWTYVSCGHGTWTNSDSIPGESDGNIVTGPTDEVCVVPLVLNCDPHQHIEGTMCVNDAPASNTGNGGGGSGGGDGGGVILGLIGGVTTNSGGNGQVLGASTDLPAGCSAYLNGYLRFGKDNNSEQVKKLQIFLNKELGLTLEVNGIFDADTFNAVNAFQLKHWEDVLKPWVAFGLQSDHTPTGYVYKTTQRMINLLQCSTLALPMPQLP